jgi:hypothetical protein
MVRVTHAFGREGGERHAQGDRHPQTRGERRMFIHTHTHTHTHTHAPRAREERERHTHSIQQECQLSVFPKIAESHFLRVFLFTNIIQPPSL